MRLIRVLLIFVLAACCVPVSATVNTSANKTTVLGNGSQTQFSFSFIGVATAYIAVIYTDASGNQTTLSQGTGSSQYQISLNTAPQGGLWGLGGTVTYNPGGTPIASGTSLTIYRTLPLTQAISLQNQISLAELGNGAETGLDLGVMEAQQTTETIGRAIVAPVVDPATINLTLPAAAQRANTGIAFDSQGNVIAGTTPATGLISSVMQPVVDAASLALGRTAFGLGGAAVLSPNCQLLSNASTAGNLDVGSVLTQVATNQSVAAANCGSTYVATGPITFTLARANTLWNGFGFWLHVVGGGTVTLAVNSNDTIEGLTSGVSGSLPVGSWAWIMTDGASSGNWRVQVSYGLGSFPPTTVFTASHTISTTDCGSTVKMGSGSTWPLTLSLPSTSGFSGSCPVTIVGQASRGVKLSGFSNIGLTSPNMLWPTKTFSIAIIGGAWTVTNADGRWKIPNNTTVYMDIVNGNDSNDCLGTGTSACVSFQQVLRTNAKDFYDFTGQTAWPDCLITVQLADNRSSGTAYSLAHIAWVPVGSEGRGSICINGDATTPSNVVISDSAGGNIATFGGGLSVEISNLQIGWENSTSPTAYGGVDAEDASFIWLQPNVIFGNATTAQISAVNNGSVIALANFSVSGSAASLMVANGGRIDLSSNGARTVTFSNNPVYTQTIAAYAGSTVLVGEVTWTNGGTVTTSVSKYFCRGATTIETDTGNGNSIPGTTNGTPGTGCSVF